MAEGRLSAQWDQTASMMAMTANAAPRKKGAPAAKPRDFHPFHQSAEEKPRGFKAIRDGL